MLSRLPIQPAPLLAAVVLAIAPALPAADDALTAAGRPPPPKRTYHAARLAGEPPRIDGRLDDACWRGEGTWSGDFIQREPKEGDPGSEPTEVKILYDDRQVYVAIRAFDSRVADLHFLRGMRDEFIGDMVGFAFDSYFDQRTAFEFDLTSGGSKLDGLGTNDGFDTTWDAVWDGRVARDDDSWTAEFAVPFNQLRYANNKPEQVWGLHVWRWIRRHQEESNWQLIPMDNSGWITCFGELHGIENIPPSRKLEFLPYLVAQRTTPAAEAGNPFSREADSGLDAGFDAKIGLSSDFMLDLTVNPDFGQVEADPSEINLTTFETFYAERRPFFLEGKNIFEFKLDEDLLFYSRRIGGGPSIDPDIDGFEDLPLATRILGAAKVTGKTASGFSLGALYAATREETAGLAENGSAPRTILVEPASHRAVARVQQDFDKGATVLGGIATVSRYTIDHPDLITLPDQAVTGGLDFRHQWNDRNNFFRLDLVGSRIDGSPEAIRTIAEESVHYFQRPDAEHLRLKPGARRLEGWGGEAALGKGSGGRWRYHGEVTWRSPGLELNDLGYLRAADNIEQFAQLDYVETEPGPLFRRYDWHLWQYSGWDFGGMHVADSIGGWGNLVFHGNSSLVGEFEIAQDELDTHVLRGGPALIVPGAIEGELHYYSDGSKNVSYRLGGGYRRGANGSHSTEIESGVSARISRFARVSGEVTHERNFDDFHYAETGAAAGSGEPRYIMGRLSQETFGTTLRFEVNFTPQLSLAWYGNAYISSGDFTDYKLVTRPRARRYEDRFNRIAPPLYDAGSDVFTGVDGGEAFTFENPNFDWRVWQSNLVLRWEYQRGSTIHLVWTQNRTSDDHAPGFSTGSEYRRLFDTPATNTVLLKVSYWFSI